MSSVYPPGQSQPPYRTASPARRTEWDRRDPQGWIRAGLVLGLAALGAFFVWPLVRPLVVTEINRYVAPEYAVDADAPPAPPIKKRHRHE